MENLEERLKCLKNIKIPRIIAHSSSNSETTLDYYYALSTTLSQLNRFREAITSIREAEQYYEKISEERKIYWGANHQYEFAFNYLELGELNKAKFHAEKSSEYFERLKSAEGMATSLDIRSLVELSLHNYDEAIQLAERSLQIRSEFEKKQLHVSYNNLGEIYRTMGNIRKSIEYYEKALEKSVQLKDYVSEAIANNNLGLSYNDLGELNAAINFFETSQEIFQQKNIFDVECSLDYTKVLIRAKRIHEALKRLAEIQKHLEKNKSNKNLCRYYLVQGKAQIQLRNLSNAYEHLNLAREIAEFSEFPFLHIEINLKLVEVSFLFARIEDNDKWLNEANDWLVLAETLVLEIKHAQLLVELKFLKALLDKEQGNNVRAVTSLRDLLKNKIVKNSPELAQRIHNVIYVLEESSEPLTKVDILIYLDKIAELVETAKH